jgi:MFS family permease
LAVHAETARSAEPWPWLFLPFGLAPAVVAGYLTVAVVDELSRTGVPLGSVSLLVTAVFVPPTLVFVWAPLVDLVGRRARWLLGGVGFLCIAAAGLALTHRTPSGFPWLVSFAALAGFGYSLVSVAQKGLAVELFAPSRRVAAAGWAGAGSGIGLALGGGMLTVAAHLPPPGVACLLVVLAGLPAAMALIALARHWASGPVAAPTLREVAQDTGRLLRSRRGRLALAICLLPFASSAAALMVGALGMDFGATADLVGTWAGTGKSLAFAAGALMGARLWQRTGARAGYLLAGIGFALFSLLVLAGPRTPVAYAVAASGYGFLQGASLSAVMGIILETVEQRAAATQAAVLVAAGNLSNIYLPPLAGWAHDAGGLTMLLVADVAVGVGGLAVFLLCARLLHEHPWRGDRREARLG